MQQGYREGENRLISWAPIFLSIPQNGCHIAQNLDTGVDLWLLFVTPLLFSK